jgi:hypothetical protein
MAVSSMEKAQTLITERNLDIGRLEFSTLSSHVDCVISPILEDNYIIFILGRGSLREILDMIRAKEQAQTSLRRLHSARRVL